MRRWWWPTQASAGKQTSVREQNEHWGARFWIVPANSNGGIPPIRTTRGAWQSPRPHVNSLRTPVCAMVPYMRLQKAVIAWALKLRVGFHTPGDHPIPASFTLPTPVRTSTVAFPGAFPLCNSCAVLYTKGHFVAQRGNMAKMPETKKPCPISLYRPFKRGLAWRAREDSNPRPADP